MLFIVVFDCYLMANKVEYTTDSFTSFRSQLKTWTCPRLWCPYQVFRVLQIRYLLTYYHKYRVYA